MLMNLAGLPLNDTVCRRVMRLYANSGQATSANLHYQNFCQLLEIDLGVSASAETQELAMQINAQSLPKPISRRRSERHQVSSLYCNLHMDSNVDPEDVAVLAEQPRAHWIAIVERLQGHVVPMNDGGLLAYFGYPLVNEKAVCNAVEAGLLIVAKAMSGFNWRAGLHTGLVISKGGHLDEVGALTHTAINVARSAAANELIISQQTRRLVVGYFDCQRLPIQMGPDHLVGLALFKVLRETGARNQFDAAKLSGAAQAPLIGRDEEIERLMDWWRLSAQRLCQWALIQGEPGVGKSRLLQAFKNRLPTPTHVWELRCEARFSEGTLHPFASLLKTLLGLDETQIPSVAFARLARFLERDYQALAASAIPLLAQLLSLPLAEPYRHSKVITAKHVESTMTVLLALLHTLSYGQPVLLIGEDMQWADHCTLTLLARYLAQHQSEPMLMLLSARPGFQLPPGMPQGNVLQLESLGHRQTRAMVNALQPEMDDPTVARIVERASGIPLYVEELAKMAALGEARVIPFSLRDLLAQRMVHLGSAKYTAQLASVLRCKFTLEMLQTLFASDRNRFELDLGVLVEQDVLVQNSAGAYQFKQTLMLEASYQSQTKFDRQAMHRSIGEFLLVHAKGMAPALPELVAWHLSAGGLIQESIDLWVETGELALSRSEHAESFSCFMHGVHLLAALPPNAEREQLASALCGRVSKSLVLLKGFGPSEYARAYRMAQRLVSTSMGYGGNRGGDIY